MSQPEDYKKRYEEMIGFVPPKIGKRIELAYDIDPDTLELIENWRMNALTPEALDAKTVQLICVAILLVQKSAATKNHAFAAKKAGATREELHSVAAIANLFGGIAAYNHAGEVIKDVFDEPETP